MISVRKDTHIEFNPRDVAGGVRTSWKFLVDVKLQRKMPDLEPTTDELERKGA